MPRSPLATEKLSPPGWIKTSNRALATSTPTNRLTSSITTPHHAAYPALQSGISFPLQPFGLKHREGAATFAARRGLGPKAAPACRASSLDSSTTIRYIQGWICEAEQFFLGWPTERQVAAAGGEKLSGEFRWLATFGNSFDDRGGKESQANHATDVALADTVTFADFDHRSRATRHQIVEPAAGSRRRLQDRGVNPRC
jgi:hypothetical protein